MKPPASAWWRFYKVFAREYLTTVRTKTFIVGVVSMPVLMVASTLLAMLVESQALGETKRCALVDFTGQLAEPLLRAANSQEKTTSLLEPGLPRVELSTAFAQDLAKPEQLKQRLEQRVKSEELFCFVEIEAGVLDGTSKAAVRYYSATPTHTALPRWLRTTIDAEVRRQRFEQSGLSRDSVERISTPIAFWSKTVASDSTGGRGFVRDALLPIGAAMLMFLVLVLTATPLMQGVLEEKMYRIAEVLVSSVSPFALLAGKLCGAIAVALTLSAIYLAGSIALVYHLDLSVSIQPLEAFWILGFASTGLCMYGAIFLGVGSLSSDLKQSQVLTAPALVLVLIPVLLLPVAISEPNSSIAVVLSLIPFFSPVLMMFRALVLPNIALWQPALALVLTAAAAAVCLVIAGRVFRRGLLTHDGIPPLRVLWSWVWRKG